MRVNGLWGIDVYITLFEEEGDIMSLRGRRWMWVVVLVVTLLLQVSVVDAKVFLSLGTGSSAGTYYYLGAGFAAIVNKYVPNIRITAQSTAAAFENARLVATKKLDLGFTCMGTLRTLKKEEGLDLSGIRLIAVGHRSDVHWMTMGDSGIKRIEDIRGKRVGVGPQGSATLRLFSIKCLKVGWNLTLKDFQPRYFSFKEIVNGLVNRTIDAGIIAAGAPVSAILNLCTMHKVRFLETPPPIAEKMHKILGYPMPFIIPAGTYPGQSKDVHTYTIRQMLICRADLPAETVYSIMKAIYTHPKEKNAIHPQAKLWNLKGCFKGSNSVPVKFHPGAIKFYKEMGIWKYKNQWQ